MNENWQTTSTLSIRLKLAIAAVLLAILGWGFVHLERNRSRRLLDESLLLLTNDAGQIDCAQTKGPQVTTQQWERMAEDAESLRVLYLIGSKSVAGGLAPVARFRNLEELVLTGCGWVDDQQIASLAGLHNLQRLGLADTSVTDVGLRSLDLSQIRWLDLKHCRDITDAGLELLSQLESLEIVELDGTSITLDGFEKLRNAQPGAQLKLDRNTILQSLCSVVDNSPWLETSQQATELARFFRLPHNWYTGEYNASERPTSAFLKGPAAGPALGSILPSIPAVDYLSLDETIVDGGFEAAPPTLKTLRFSHLGAGSDLSQLTSLKGLESLDISNTLIPAGELKFLPQLSSLEYLGLAGVAISKVDLQTITRCPSLRVVSLATMSVPDHVAEAIAALPNLEHLTLYKTDVSPEAIERIRKQHPRLQLRIE